MEPVAQLKRLDILETKIRDTVDQLSLAVPMGRARIQDQCFQFLRELLHHNDGMERLYQIIPHLIKSGLLVGGGWEHPDRLIPSLVRGSFFAQGVYPLIEIISELRVLAISEGKIEDEAFSSADAEKFLIEALALNLDILFKTHSEEHRVHVQSRELFSSLLDFLFKKIDNSALFDVFVQEITELSAQRPIMANSIVKLVSSGREMIYHNPQLKRSPIYERFDTFYKALYSPSACAENHPDILGYREALFDLSPAQVEQEALEAGELLRSTGLAGAHSAIFLRFLARKYPQFIPSLLGLSESGKNSFDEHQDFVIRIIRQCIRPSTSSCIHAMARILELHLLSQRTVRVGIEKLVELDVHPEVVPALLKRRKKHDSITANSILVSGLISVLGLPLGVGQGNNPTCQSARGISLWAQHDPAYLIDILISASRNNTVELSFEGAVLCSKSLPRVLDKNFDSDLDPVSLVLAPHLDALYNEIMRRVALRGEDGHKWANPALYGRLINFGFESALDPYHTYVKDYENFIRRFYATHHPEFCETDHNLYVNPVGIFVTNSRGLLIGLHAISIQRVALGPDGEVRVYFYNPNNEGRQDWGQSVQPKVCDHGEIHGESSLPFHHFASRLYAYHFNPYEEGDGYAVPKSEIDKIVTLAKESWGVQYQWIQHPD
jgi:hypothetical protein